MKTLQRLLRRYWIALLMVLMVVVYAVAQTPAAPTTPSVPFPWVLAVPYFIGVIVHWYKKYKMDGVKIPFSQWYGNNIGFTVSSLVIGWGSVTAIWAMNPAALPIDNPASYLQIFMLAIGADTVNQSNTGTTPNAGQGAQVN